MVALGARRELSQKKPQHTGNGMFYTAGGIAVRRSAEIIESGSGALLSDSRIYYPFDVGKDVYVLTPTSIRIARETQVR